MACSEWMIDSLTLLVTTSLFLTREPIRKACLDKSSGEWSYINQLSWLSYLFPFNFIYCHSILLTLAWLLHRFPIGIGVVSVLSYIWMYVLPTPEIAFYKEVFFSLDSNYMVGCCGIRRLDLDNSSFWILLYSNTDFIAYKRESNPTISNTHSRFLLRAPP